MYHHPVRVFKNPTFKAIVNVGWTPNSLQAVEIAEIGIGDFLANSSAQEAS